MAKVTFIPGSGTLAAYLSGEIDHHAAQSLRKEIDAQIDDRLPELLTLDFSGVTFMDSSGVGLILGRGRHIGALGGRLTVQNPPRAVRQLADIKTAVSEAVTNCIVHAYPDRIGPITMTAAIYEGGVVRITITDRGVGIPDIAKAMEPMFTTGDAEERAGLGFAVMQNFMDKVKVSSAPGRGTRVTLTKRLDARA